MILWDEHEDDISDAISNSIDIDWISRTGAKAVVAWLNENAAAPAAPQAAGVGEDVRDAVSWLEGAFSQEAVGFSTSYRPTMAAVHTVLSAIRAPSREPEGGAVRQAVIGFDVEEYIEGYEFRGDEGGYTPTDDERALITDAIHGVLSELSLATREEAPAELLSDPQKLEVPAEAAPCPFCGCRMRVSYDSEREMYGPDGDHLPGCIIGNWDLHEYAFRPDALAAWNSRSVRAQPQAREDARRDGLMSALAIVTDPGIITGLHTAVEARSWIERSIRSALSALQAEQGVK